MYGTSSASYGFGYAIGTLIGLAIVIAIMYVLPAVLAATIFHLKKKQVVGVIALTYAIACSLMSLVGMVVPNGGVFAPFFFIAIFNIIATIVCYATQSKVEENGKQHKK